MGIKKTNRLGEIRINNQGLLMKIIRYNGRADIDVQFEDGYTKYNSYYSNFEKGRIRNPYKKDVYGIGYFGEGEGKNNPAYSSWNHMMSRCYSKNRTDSKLSTYNECFVCEEWHNFQNFIKWYNENYYEIENEKMQLDKDILIKGNKIYSPDTCIFVPQRINKLFVKSNKIRGKLPIGVAYHTKNNNYTSHCSINNKNKHLGSFKSPEEAFYAYKEFKENYIKIIANKYKEKYLNIFPEKLYIAMHSYEVEVTD